MRYSKLSLEELNNALTETKAAIERGHDLLQAIPRLPNSKAFEKVTDSTGKLIGKLQREAEKLERAQEKNSAREARNGRNNPETEGWFP